MKNLIKKIMAPTKYLAAIIALLGLLLCCANTSWGQSITVPNGGFSAQNVFLSTGSNPYTVITGWTVNAATSAGVTNLTTSTSGVVGGALYLKGTASGSAGDVLATSIPNNDVTQCIDISAIPLGSTFTAIIPMKAAATQSGTPHSTRIKLYDANGVDVTIACSATTTNTGGAINTSGYTNLQSVNVTSANTTGIGGDAKYIAVQALVGKNLLAGVYIDNVLLSYTSNPPVITVGTPTSTALTYEYGQGPSAAESFTVGGTNMTGNLVLTPGTNIELSSTSATSGFQGGGALSLAPTSGTLSTTTIYARLVAGIALGSAGSNGVRTVTITNSGATPQSILYTCSVTGFIPGAVSGTVLSYEVGNGPSTGQSFAFTSNVTSNIEVTPGSNLEVSSTAGSGFQSTPLTLTPGNYTIYTRLKVGLSAGNYNDITTQVVVSSTGSTSFTKSFNGNVSQTITNYYYKGTGLLSDASSWGVNADGTGANPTAITDANANFVITNGPATTAAAWILGSNSKVIVGNGSAVTLTVDDTFPITGTIDATASGVVVWKHLLSSPTFGILDNASEVHLTPAANASYGLGNGTAYGKLFIDGAGKVSVLAGITSSTATVKNAFTVASGSTLDFPVTNTHSITINAGASATINGTVKAGKEEGFAGTVAGGATTTKVSVVFADAIPNLTLGTSSTIDYYRPNAAQTVSALPSGVNYANLTLSETGCTAATSKVIPTTGVTVNGTLTVSLAGVAFASTTVNADKITLANGATIVRTLGALDAAPLYSGTYNVTYNGTTAQTIGVELPTAVSNALNNLTVNNVAGVTLGSNTTINGMLTLTSGKLILPANGILRIASGNAIVGGSSTNYIVADPSSVVRMDAIASERLLPIGNATKYLPVTITPASTESLNISVFDGITGSGTFTGTALGSAQKTSVVDAVWNISQVGAVAATNSTVKVEWPASLEGADYTSAAAADLGLISNSGTGGWNSPTGAIDKTNHSATATVTSFGSFSAGRAAMLFAQPAAKTYGDADFPAVVTSLNTSVITYASIPTSVATIDAAGIIHIVGAGTATITASQASDGVYAAVSISRTLTVNKAALTITADDQVKFLSAVNPTLTATYTGFQLGETEAVLLTPAVFSTTADVSSVRGGYPITVSGATSNNYAISFVAGSLQVLNAAFEFDVIPVKTFGDADFDGGAFSVNTITPIVYSSDNAAVATIVAGKIHIVGAGTANITSSQQGSGVYPAYSITQLLTVNKAPMTISFAALPTKGYGDADFDPAATSSNSVIPIAYSSSNTSVATIVAGKIHIVGAGSCIITAAQTGNDNYITASSVDQALTVNKAALSFTADNKSKYVGQVNPTLSFVTAGFVLGETETVLSTPLAISTTAVTASVAGTYPITLSGATATNYSISFVDAIFTVKEKEIQTITFAALATKTYGNVDFAAGGSSTNASIAVVYTSSNTAVATIVGTNVHIVGAGTADITASQAGSDVYAAATSVVKTLTISKAALKITADNKSKTTEQVNPVLTVTYTGFVLSETSAVLQTPVVISTTAVTASLPGTYPITASAAAAANYTISFVAGTLTVNPKTVQTISFAALAAKMYGNADFAAGGTSNNATLPVMYSSSNQGVATIIGNMIHIMGAGTTVITASQNGDALYYPALNVSRTLTVSKVPLTIKAIDTTKIQGEDNPVFAFTYTGLVAGETGANLFSKVSTSALKGSAAGHYSIAPTGADTSNYIITYVSGRFTIYPPAGKDQINLNAYRSSSSQLTLQIYSTQFIVADAILYNLNGTPIKSVGCNVPKGFSTTKMDLPFLLPGLYIIKVKGWSIDCKKIISIL